MKNIIVFVKLNLSAPSVRHAINYVEDSFNNKKENYYYTTGVDTVMLTDFQESVAHSDCFGQHIVFIMYRKTTDINSAEVAAFDDKAERIVKKLFDLYCSNPRLLHTGTLQRIYSYA